MWKPAGMRLSPPGTGGVLPPHWWREGGGRTVLKIPFRHPAGDTFPIIREG